MPYRVSELVERLCVPDRTLRDWLATGAPHFRDQQNNLWIHGRDFADWVASWYRPVMQQKLREGEAYCMHCNKSVVMNDISIHPRHGKLISLHGKCPTWAAENRVETWLPGIIKKVIHH